MTPSQSEEGADLERRAPTPTAGGGPRYDAFISYSHAADGKLAPALRNGLQRFGTPWGPFRWTNAVRSLRIFQDEASLAANPALWATIEHALAATDWFVLLASPQSSQSLWVQKEVSFWHQNKRSDHLLIVQTDGEIAWNDTDFDWTRTTALPRGLSGVFTEEPRWIDARWARTGGHASLRDPRFRDLVAELAAPLRGIAKDALIGEDIRQYQRLNRWRNAAFAVLTTLFISAAVAASVAVEQRRVAIAQRDQAQRNQSRALAVLANAQAAAGHPATALRVALAGLPQAIATPDRAHALEAEGAALLALRHLRELRLIGEAGSVTSVAFSPDGLMLATGSAGNTARLWEVATGKEIATLRGNDYFAYNVVFGPDGRTLATIGTRDDTVRLWELATRRQLVVVRGNSVAFSPDGRTLATGSTRHGDTAARLWDAATGREIAALQGHKSSVSLVVFSPDGTKVLTSSSSMAERRLDGTRVPTASDDLTVRLWDAANGQPLVVLRGHDDWIASAVFGPDGTKVLTASDDNTARLWDAASGRQLYVLRHEHRVSLVRFSPDGRKVLTASDKLARLWEGATGSELAVLRGHENRLLAVAFSPDGRTLATASEDKTVRLWEAGTGTEIESMRDREGTVGAVVFSPDGRTLATLSDTGARLWDATEDREITFLPHGDNVRSVAFSPDGAKVVTVSWDATLRERVARLWSATSGKELAALRGHGNVSSAVFSPDGTKVLAASDDKTVRLWDVSSGKELGVLRGHEDGVASAVFSSDGSKMLTASDDKTARLWDVASGKELAVLRGHTDQVKSAAFSPDGTRAVTASNDHTAVLWNVASGQQLAALHGHGEWVQSATFSPDGSKVLTASWDHTARLWDGASGKELAVLRHATDKVSSAVFSPDGMKILTASWNSAPRLWDAASGKEFAVLRGHESNVGSVAFSPDGRTVATGSSDGTVRLWDAASGKELAVLSGVETVVFSADARILATVSLDPPGVRLWPVGQGLIDRACASVHDLPLSDDEKRQFGVDDEWCTPEVSAALRVKLASTRLSPLRR